MHFDSVGESEVGVNLEAEKKRWNQWERATQKGRVHHRSVVAGFNQLLTPCRLAAVPTNDAMMAVSFPRTAAHLGEWWSGRKGPKSNDERWTGRKKNKTGESRSKLVMWFVYSCRRETEGKARLCEECLILRGEEMKSSHHLPSWLEEESLVRVERGCPEAQTAVDW